MPRLTNFYMGLDPGEKGGIAVINSLGGVIFTGKVPDSAKKLLNLMQSIKDSWNITSSAIERIDPRPTGYKDKRTGQWISTILRSTCIIYGDFLQLHMAALAIGLDPEVVGPHDWQKYLEIPKKAKGEKGAEFKRRLKEIAVELFPGTKVTLAIADALLIAEYCRRKVHDLHD